jgi:hypothetical protein
VIWGMTPGVEVELLLVTKYLGSDITEESVAKMILADLESQGCRNLRIEEVNRNLSNVVTLFEKKLRSNDLLLG